MHTPDVQRVLKNVNYVEIRKEKDFANQTFYFIRYFEILKIIELLIFIYKYIILYIWIEHGSYNTKKCYRC